GSESCSSGGELEALGTELGVLREAEREQRCAVGRTKLVGETPAVVVADVYRGRRRLVAGEQPPLRLEVPLERAVEVEVVLGQVREDEHGEADAIQAAELRAVRSRLHRDTAVAGVQHRSKAAL